MAASACGVSVLSGCTPAEAIFPARRTMTDDAGREVNLPAASAISRVYFTSPLAQIFCMTLAPELLAGTALMFDEEQLDYLPEGVGELPFLGSLVNGNVIYPSVLREAGVQIIFSISGAGITDVNVADAIELQADSGIPVFLIDGSLDKMAESYRKLGEIFGMPERAERLGAYCERIYNEVTEVVATIPLEERVSYYFAEGPEGLQTENDASQHSLAFLSAGGVNVAADAHGTALTDESIAVSLPQVLEWNPEVIVTWDWPTRGGAADLIKVSPAWQDVSAVLNDRVYAMPSTPFPFCDRPPSVNRILGMRWLTNLFYPEQYDIDMVAAVQEFYSLFYWRDLTREQAQTILQATTRSASVSLGC